MIQKDKEDEKPSIKRMITKLNYITFSNSNVSQIQASL